MPLTIPAQAAIEDYQQGIYSVPIPPATKAPKRKKWPELRLGPDEIPRAFASTSNRGRLLGIEPPHDTGNGFIVCVDLDTPQALTIAPTWLPPTGEIGGRGESSRSHWFYECSPPPPTTRYTTPRGIRLLEVLSTGAQVLVPPSVHPSGDPYLWDQRGPRCRVQSADLLAACGVLASATMLARHWPPKGTRQHAALALAGALRRSNWTPEAIERFIRSVADAASDEEATKRGKTGASTCQRLARQEDTSGWPTLARIFGEEQVTCLRDWLDIVDHPQNPPTRNTPPHISSPRTNSPPPAPLGPAAYYGLAGDTVTTIAPHTEADPAALLFQFLTAFGNATGSSPSFSVEATHHRTNLFCVLVGASSKARKGTSWQHIRRLFRLATHMPQPTTPGIDLTKWLHESIKDGLSSGEGLIWHVRDSATQWKPDRKGGGREIVADPGVEDKRLLIQTGELVGSIRCMSRNGNTLSAVLRSAWDSGDLRILTRHQPVTASGAHISIVGHITTEELRHSLSELEVANGFANRFLWVYVRRSKLLPEGGALADADLCTLAQRLRQALHNASARGVMRRDEPANRLWRAVYPRLSVARPGLWGSITGRAEAQVVRLSLIYALLDRCKHIGVPHLQAALDVWRYADQSVRFIFGDATGDAVTDAILEALRASPEGLTRTDLHNLFSRHITKERVDQSLRTLADAKSVGCRREQTRGRPRETWFATIPDSSNTYFANTNHQQTPM